MLRKTLLATTVAMVAAAIGTAPVASATGPSLTYTPSPSWWGTNGRVMDILPVGNRVYLGGGFDYVGPTTGHGVTLDLASGARLGTSPMIDGVVNVAAPDGSGGWYVGGDFTHVGGAYRPRAAQINANGTVSSWSPKPSDPVYAITTLADRVILAGAASVPKGSASGTQASAQIMAVDRTQGVAMPGWSARTNGTVQTLTAAGGNVYAGGSFTTVNNLPRTGLVRLNAATGSIDPTFTGRTIGAVRTSALSASGTQLYVGGEFTSASSGSTMVTRNRLAAYDVASGALTGWAPVSDGIVNVLTVDPASGTVYAGGMFSAIGGAARPELAGITPSGTVNAQSFGLNGCHTPHVTSYAHSNPPCSPEVTALAVSNGALYVGGRFGKSGTAVRHDAAAFSLGDASLTSWNPVSGDRILALAASGSAMFAGGELTSVGGAVRKGLAALNLATGALDASFTADTDNEVLDLVASPDGSRLYAAGSFMTVQGNARAKLASIITSTSLVDPSFKPKFNQEVLSMGYAGGSLYVAGQFTKISGVARNHAAKLSAATGAVDSGFVANTVGPSGPLRANGMVQSMAVSPDATKVYLGGPFTTVNGTTRPGGIAVVDGTTGALLPRQLGGVLGCGGVGPWLTHLYLSGDGKRLYGGDVCPDNIYQWDAVNLSSTTNPTGLNWRTACNAGMQGTLEVNGTFYYGSHGGDKGSGGYCWTSPTNQTRVSQQRFFAFDAVSGTLLPDAPDFDTPMGVWSFAAIPQGLLVGGDFTYAGSADHVQQGLALFPGTMGTDPAPVSRQPGVTTGATTGTTSTGATLTGVVNPNGAATGYQFQYGTSTTYGTTTTSTPIGSGTSAVNVTTAVSGLTPGQTYHYRVVATNVNGTTTGADGTFTTPGGAAGACSPGSMTATDTADATVDASKPTKNYGTTTDLKATSQGTTKEHTAYLSFATPAVPDGCTVSKVTLTMVTGQSGVKQQQSIDVHAQDATSWAEGTLTWSNHPAPGASIATGLPFRLDSANQQQSFTLPSAAAWLHPGGTTSISLTSSTGAAKRFVSKEGSASLAPALAIDYA